MNKKILKSFTLLMFGSLIGLFIYFNSSRSTTKDQKIKNRYSRKYFKQIENNSDQLNEPHIKFDGESNTYSSTENESKLMMYSSKSAPAFHSKDFYPDPTVNPLKP